MMSDERVVVEQSEMAYRHSTGHLGTQILTALSNRRILGWRTGRPARVIVPPKDLGLPGEWVELGPNARLIAYAPREWLPGLHKGDENSFLALVLLEGADTAMLSRVQLRHPAAELAPDTALWVRFCAEPKGAITDFWFAPTTEGA
jgi:uncharacterized OB-fold protein